MMKISMPTWALGAIRGAKPVALPVGAAALGLGAGYQVAFKSSNKGDFMHPTAWGLGAVEGVVLAGVPAIALAMGGPILARRAATAVLRTARDAATEMHASPNLTKAQLLEKSELAFSGIEHSATTNGRLAAASLPVGLAGVGGVLGTTWAIDVTQARLDKPNLHVTVDQNVTLRSETATSVVERNVTDAGKSAGNIISSVGSAIGGLFK